MSLLRSLARQWARLREAARREFLRDPAVVLFDRPANTVRESAHGR